MAGGLVALSLLLGMKLFGVVAAKADTGSRVVSIYIGEEKHVLSTSATTVGAALNEAHISLQQGDAVEPKLDTTLPNGFFNINVYRATPYRIVDGESVSYVRSANTSPRLIAAEAGVSLYPEDKVEVEAIDNFAADRAVGQNIIITRAQVATVVIDGQRQQLRTQGSTVGALLADNNIHLGNADHVQPSLTTDLRAGLVITVARVRVATETTDETLPRPVQQIQDKSLTRGTKQVRSEGADGKRRVTSLVTYNNGVVVSRKQLSVQVVQQAEPRVEVIGTRAQYDNPTIQLGFDMAADRGWTGGQWDSLYKLWMRESGWNANSINNASGACGIPQAYPCSKIKDRSAAGQIRWGLDYIAGRYGSPSAAWAYWLVHGSY